MIMVLNACTNEYQRNTFVETAATCPEQKVNAI